MCRQGTEKINRTKVFRGKPDSNQWLKMPTSDESRNANVQKERLEAIKRAVESRLQKLDERLSHLEYLPAYETAARGTAQEKHGLARKTISRTGTSEKIDHDSNAAQVSGAGRLPKQMSMEKESSSTIDKSEAAAGIQAPSPAPLSKSKDTRNAAAESGEGCEGGAKDSSLAVTSESGARHGSLKVSE